MFGTKLLTVMLAANIFIVLVMELSATAGGSMSSAYLSNNDPNSLPGILGFTNLSAYTAHFYNDTREFDNSTYASITGNISGYSGEGVSEGMGIGAFWGVWNAIVGFVSFLIKVPFAPILLIWGVGLGDTILMPIVGYPLSFLCLFLIVQFFWRQVM